jgi:predicted branched-subunit amino acid permease
MTAVTAAADTTTRATARGHVLGGARAMAPWLFGIVPYGFVIGVSAAAADIPKLVAWLTGPLVFSGSAQVATLELLGKGAAPVVVVVAALAINLRLVLYSAAMAEHWTGTSRRWRAVAASMLVDPTLAVGVAAYEQADDANDAHLHYLGGAVTLGVAWLAAITLGMTVGSSLPAGLHLEFVIPLFLVGEVTRRATTRAARHGVTVAVVLAVIATGVPLHLGVLLAIAGGTAAAVAAAETAR